MKKPEKNKKNKKSLVNKKKPPTHSQESVFRVDFMAPKIKIVGVGGAGGNALSRIESLLSGIETIAFNTDVQDLKTCKASKKVQIGKELAQGRGAGMNPEIGRHSAEENREEIQKALEGSELVFLTCGLGGGTGSGATPVVAEVARSLGILTIAVVTTPFSFEGKERQEIAHHARLKLLEKVDALVTIPNDRVFNIIDTETSLKRAFWQIDEILREGIQAIYDLIVKPGQVNVDFSDLKAIVKDSGEALLGIGTADGKDRAVKAAERAIKSPLLEITIENARGVLFNISSREDLTMIELQTAAKAITNQASPDAKVIFGASFDHRLPKNKIKITVVATGFNKTENSSHSPLPFSRSQEIAKYSFNNESKKQEEEYHGKDVLKEKLKQFESLEDEPAFLRKNKPRN